jgi:hypothetical protein
MVSLFNLANFNTVYDECGIDYETKVEKLQIDFKQEKQRTENLRADMLKY